MARRFKTYHYVWPSPKVMAHRGWWKILKNVNMDIFSDTMISAVMKLGTKELCDEALQSISVWVTFTQGHSHKGWWKIVKIHRHFSDTCHHYSHESWHSDSTWQSLSGHASFSDFHPRSEELMEKLGNSVTLVFSRTLSCLQSWNLARWYSLARPFRAYQRWWPSPKIKVTRVDENPGKHYYCHFLRHCSSYSLSNYTCLDDLQSRSRS